jgi:hypothetical protein
MGLYSNDKNCFFFQSELYSMNRDRVLSPDALEMERTG